MKNKRKSAECASREANQAVARAVAAWNRVDALRYELKMGEERAEKLQEQADEATLKARAARDEEWQV